MVKIEMLVVPYTRIREMMALDLTGKVEQRLGCDYLAWADAELLMREHFPTYKIMYTIETIPRSAADYVAILAWLVDLDTGLETPREFFPVMDGGRARADIPNPGTRPISDSIKRAGVKVIARETGIGLTLYLKEKEDIPSEVKLERTPAVFEPKRVYEDDMPVVEFAPKALKGLKKLV